MGHTPRSNHSWLGGANFANVANVNSKTDRSGGSLTTDGGTLDQTSPAH